MSMYNNSLLRIIADHANKYDFNKICVIVLSYKFNNIWQPV